MNKFKLVFEVAKDYWQLIKNSLTNDKPTYLLVRCGSGLHASWLASELKNVEGVQWVVMNPPMSQSGYVITDISQYKSVYTCPKCGGRDIIDASQSLDCNTCGHSW